MDSEELELEATALGWWPRRLPFHMCHLLAEGPDDLLRLLAERRVRVWSDPLLHCLEDLEELLSPLSIVDTARRYQ